MSYLHNALAYKAICEVSLLETAALAMSNWKEKDGVEDVVDNDML